MRRFSRGVGSPRAGKSPLHGTGLAQVGGFHLGSGGSWVGWPVKRFHPGRNTLVALPPWLLACLLFFRGGRTGAGSTPQQDG